jgi:hypothetical protein
VVVSGQNEALAELAKHTSVPLATGERMFTVEDFRDLLQQRSVNILQSVSPGFLPIVQHLASGAPRITS